MSRTSVIHQWSAGASTGDAVTSYAMSLREMVRRWGFESEFFSQYRHVSFDMRKHCRDIRSFPAELPEGSIVIYHFSIGSDLTERFLSLPPGITRIIYYHNITPPRYFRSLKPQTAEVLEEGLRQLQRLAPHVDLALGASSYSCRDLEEAGCRRTGLVPLIRKAPDLSRPPDPGVLATWGGRAINWIFVGRVAPNKKLEDVIKAFFYYRRIIRPHSRLFLVGSFGGMERYYSSLTALAVQLDLPDVIFTGHVTDSQLLAYYRLAHVFVSMSEHEGFCLPLVEAMSFGIPVVAYAAAAIPETVGGGGMVFDDKDFRMVAELADLAAVDGETRGRLIAAGGERLRDFDAEAVDKALRRSLEDFLPKSG